MPAQKAATATTDLVEKAKGKTVRELLRGNFEQEYVRLNVEQKKAVDTIDGPVMVVAGPGTGKTQTLAMRVANILRKTQMRPSNILCLTYSVSGATAMRERLRKLIGADAYGVTVSTIHAFAQSVIDHNAIVFEEWSAKQQLTDIEKYRELNKIIDQISSQSELINLKDPYAKDGDLLMRISQVKREGKSIKDLERVAAEYEAALAVKSKPGTKAHEKNLLTAKKFNDFIEIVRRYQAMLAETGRYDYDDMILNVLAALREEDWLLQSLQERYQYILVDEFQDLNGSQYALIDLLTTYEGIQNDPNIFVVGDDDQAIYRFQGANYLQMLGFHNRFPRAPVIALTTSYRSTQSILDAARALIEQNSERLVGKIPGLQKLLTAASGKRGEEPVLLRPPSDTAEPWLIADLIEERLGRGVPYEEIAVLVRKNHELFPLYDVLRSRGIPVLLRGKTDLLTHPLILQTLAILHAVEDPRSDPKLSAALACDCFAIPPSDLARLHGAARERKKRLHDVLMDAEKLGINFLDCSKISAARETILRLESQVPLRTVLETVEHVIRDLGIIPLPSDAALESIDPRDAAAVEAFFNYVKNRCLDKPAYTYREFLSDLRFYADPLYGQARLTYELPHLTSNGIRLMTAHQSKGLEFDTVIISNLRDGHWDGSQARSMVSIPEDLLFGWEKEQKSTERHEDDRRLMFVAATRARSELIMVCPREQTVGEKLRTISPSAFFAEMGALSEQDAAIKDPQGASVLLRPKAKLMDGASEAYVRERLKTFALSATSLNRFLRDPREFLLVDLLQQPEHFDEGAVRRIGYGQAVHWALKEWAAALQKKNEFGITELLEAFDWHLRERTILTEKQREDLHALGTQALTRYFEQRLAGQSPLLYAIEKDYRARLLEPSNPDDEGIPLKGKIDRIDIESPTSSVATVIDYKAGKGKTELEIRGGAEEGTVSRTEDGGQFRQLVFYALLLEQGDPMLRPTVFALEYLGEKGEHPIRRNFTVTEAEKVALKMLIRDVWSKILSLDFNPPVPPSHMPDA